MEGNFQMRRMMTNVREKKKEKRESVGDVLPYLQAAGWDTEMT